MNPYDAVLVDLRAKRDAMTELIAALENVARLTPSAAALAAPIDVTADTEVRPSVRPSVRTRTVPRVKAKPTRRATGDTLDDVIVARVNAASGGIRRADLESAFPDGTTGYDISTTMLRLVDEGRIARHGAGRASRYWPAGTTAKEAL